MTDPFEKLVQSLRDAVKTIEEIPVIDMDAPILHLGENLRACLKIYDESKEEE